MNQHYYVIIMAGGIGSRFWPMSRSSFPKQFHDILGSGASLIQQTFNRFAEFVPAQNIYIVTNAGYRDLVKDQLPDLKPEQVLAEPRGRNTAPCVAYASYKIKKQDPNAVLIVAPSDHLIEDEATFSRNVQIGLNACSKEPIIMTLGITPSRPDTGYGYLQYLEEEGEHDYYKVKTFTEKPSLEIAQTFIDSGDFLWNSGIFMFSAETIINSFEYYLPEMADLFEELNPHYYEQKEEEEIERVYATCQSVSIDIGIMEKADNVYVIPSDFGWSDLGTWSSVHENSGVDFHGNAAQGNLMLYECFNNVVRVTDKKKLVLLEGLEGYIVVDTGDTLLVCRKEKEQMIKQFVSDVKGKKGEQYV